MANDEGPKSKSLFEVIYKTLPFKRQNPGDSVTQLMSPGFSKTQSIIDQGLHPYKRGLYQSIEANKKNITLLENSIAIMKFILQQDPTTFKVEQYTNMQVKIFKGIKEHTLLLSPSLRRCREFTKISNNYPPILAKDIAELCDQLYKNQGPFIEQRQTLLKELYLLCCEHRGKMVENNIKQILAHAIPTKA